MNGSRTHLPALPRFYVKWWHENILPKKLEQIRGSAPYGGGILQRRDRFDDDEVSRLRRFGPAWSWWAVPQDLREDLWRRDRDGTST